MSRSLTDASTYLRKALLAIDAEMSNLQARLHADAAHLREAIEAADLSDGDRDSLLHSLARVEETAESVATFAHRHKDKSKDKDKGSP